MSEAKGEFLGQLLHKEAVEAAILSLAEADDEPEEVPARLPGPSWNPAFRLVHARLLGAVAAALLLLAAGWWLWSSRQEPTTNSAPPSAAEGPLLGSVIERDVRLAGAETPRQRYAILTDLAGDLHLERQTLTQVSADEDLTTLAQLYDLVLREGVQIQAGLVPPDERATIPPPAADCGAAPPHATERALRFRQDSGLIQTLVQMSLQLARHEDPLERADLCQRMAELLADELQRAAENREKARILELGQYLQTLLEEGVAFNLSLARKVIPRNSSREKALQALGDRVRKLLQPVEEQLRRDADHQDEDEVRHTLRALHDSRQEVENALRASDRPPGRRSP
jgi:hypothetical protein